jgi:hypothetical protein
VSLFPEKYLTGLRVEDEEKKKKKVHACQKVAFIE